MNETQWLPGIVVIAVSAAAAVGYLLLGTRRDARRGEADAVLDLDQRLGMLLEQLQGLEADKAALGPERYVAEKARLEAEAAGTLKERAQAVALAQAPAAPASSEPSAPKAADGFFARHPELRGAAWGAGVVLFVVALAWGLFAQTRDRGEGGMTGRIPPGATAQAQPDDGFEAALRSAQADPSNLEATAMVVHELIRRQQFDEADNLTRRSLAADPFHVETRIHRAVLRSTQGELREAMEELGQLSTLYPDSHEALLFRGVLAMQLGDKPAALESFERFWARAPVSERPPQLDGAIRQLRAELGR
jgi:tetratricopeptide (TPR) repeat protein